MGNPIAKTAGNVPFPAFVLIGLDEVGRGPLAGPVTAAGVVLRPGYENARINDSKQLSHQRRVELYDEICANALATAVVSVGPRRIERLNIREASRLAMLLCVERIVRQLGCTKKDFNGSRYRLLIDGNTAIATSLPQETIIKGDGKLRCIAAASILAKVTRDALMDELDRRFPGYELAKNKGYPTKDHFRALERYGPSRIHRRTFGGVRELLQSAGIGAATLMEPSSISGSQRRGDCQSLPDSAGLSGAQTELALSVRRT